MHVYGSVVMRLLMSDFVLSVEASLDEDEEEEGEEEEKENEDDDDDDDDVQHQLSSS